MRVLTILARYGTEDYPDAERQVADVFARQLKAAQRDVIVVDNALPAAVKDLQSAGTVIGGDNQMWEFSAFDRGVVYAGSDLDGYDLIHFATSAFNTLYTGYLERFSIALLRAAKKRGFCLGHIDCYNEPVRLQSFVSQHWVRTCFFFLSPPDVRALGSFVSSIDRHRVFSGDPDAPFRPDAPLSANYQHYILSWLTGQDIGQGVSWHSRLTLSPGTLDVFEQKALCLLHEQMLGIRLRAMGCPLMDVTWLSGRPDANRALDLLVSWREQLAGRDRDQVFVPLLPDGSGVVSP